MITHLIFYPGIQLPVHSSSSICGYLQDTPWIDDQWFFGLWIEERDEEEGDVVLPRQPSVGRQVNGSKNIAVSVGSIRDQQLTRVDRVVNVPATSIDVNVETKS